MGMLAAAVLAATVQTGRQGPWTKEKAWAWHDAQPWYRGCNYMPASAANRVDQWQSYGSEARFAEVEREFALAEEVGFNAMRLLILEQGFCVWLQEHDAFMANFERNLGLMDKYGLKAFVCLGNDCSRPKRVWTMPKLGEQQYDVGYHGGRKATQHGGFPGEPGYLMMDDPEYREKFFEMCRELVTKYAHDGRVVMWELWNEPGAGNRGMMSAQLIKDLFALCWKIDPDQPLSANLWSPSTWNLLHGGDPTEIEQLAADLSDVITYHGYNCLADQERLADEMQKRWGRPLYNTEWLFRIVGCEFPDNYAFMARRKIGALNWGFVNGKYQTHEPYEPMWKTKYDFGGGDVTKWMHDLFRISHHPYDPYEIAVARNVNAWADCDREGTSLRKRIAAKHKITGEDMWYGYCRTKFDFDGHAAWIVEPLTFPSEGTPWTWTMQWAEAYVDRTGVLDLLKRGYHHVTIDLFDTRMDEKGLAAAAVFQKFLVEEFGFAPKANLVGMSWGGFFSTRYAAAYPENVAKIYLDAPLLTFDGFGNPDYGRIGVWADRKPSKGVWADDPEMPVNKAGRIAAAGIPVLLVYGGADTVVPPKPNCETFAERFKAAGGSIIVNRRSLFGHHPHGLDPDKTKQIVDFILRPTTLPVVPAVRSTKITDAKLPSEGYRIRIDAAGKTKVEFADEAGCFYANKTLDQLPKGARNLEIEDWPAYRWRGVMLDEGRHFFGKTAVKDILARMSALKMNVFHWHLTEDQGWRLDIPGMPELVKYGAVRPHSWKTYTEKEPDGKPYGPFLYTPDDVREIVEYAKGMKIRVIPEIELPGHARALLAAHPEFSCTGEHPRHPWTETGVTEEVLCAGNDEAIRYLERVFDRVVEMFPDEVVHIGGDECPKAHWKACPKCQARMKKLGLKDENALQVWLTHHFVDYLKAKGKRAIGWDEILEGGLGEGAMVQSWRMAGWQSSSADGKIAKSPVVRAAEEGHDVVASSLPYTYFSLPSSTNETTVYRRPAAKYGAGELVPLEKVYAFDPCEGVPASLRSRIVGSEGCNWTEGTRDYENLKAKMWPRTAALAEVLWTGACRPGFEDFQKRMKKR